MNRNIKFLFLVATSLSLFAFPLMADETRVWTDTTGKFKVTAKFIEMKGTKVILEKEDGSKLTIPIAKLSEKDQAFLEGMEAANPFSEMEEEDSAADKSPSGKSEKPRKASTGPIDWSEVETIEILGGDRWEIKVSENAGIGFEPKKIPLPKKGHFFENIHPLAVNLSAKKVAIGYTTSFSIPTPLTRLAIGDLETGKMVSSEAVEANMKPLCLLNDGTTVLMLGLDDKTDGPSTLQEWTIKGKKVTQGESWQPFQSDLQADSKGGRQSDPRAANIASAIALPSNSILLCSVKGHLACFDASSRAPKWHAQLGEAPTFSCNSDQSLITFVHSGQILVLKTDTGEVLGQISIQDKGHLPWPKVAFSPSGKKLALGAWDRVLILDVEKKEWIQELTFPGANVGNAFAFPDEEYVLFDNRVLIHWPTRIQLWTLLDVHATSSHGEYTFLCCNSDAGGLLFPTKLPTPAALAMFDAARKKSDLFVVRPGASVSLNLNGVPQQYMAEVKSGLEKSIGKIGLKIAANAEVQVVASVTGPKQEAVSYRLAGSHIVQSYASNLALQYKGQTIWQSGASNIPGMIMVSGDESVESYLAKASAAPNLKFFGQITLPEYLQKPAPAGANGNQPQNFNTLGASKLTVNGLQ